MSEQSAAVRLWLGMDTVGRERANRYLTGRHKSPATFVRRFGKLYGIGNIGDARALSRWLEYGGGARQGVTVAAPSASAPRGAPVDDLIADYSSDGGNKTAAQIAEERGLSVAEVKTALRRGGATHASLPFSDETVEDTDADVLAERALVIKRRAVRDAIKRKSDAAVRVDAAKYRDAAALAESLGEYIAATAPDYAPSAIVLPPAGQPYEVIVPLADLHMGRYGRDGNGQATYSRGGAKSRLIGVTQESIARLTLRGRPESVTLVMLGDGLDVDTAGGTTTKGTPQVTDGDAELALRDWFELCRAWVDAWRAVAPVTILVIPGNHDRLISAALRAGLVGWFRGVDDVRVESSLDHRQYIVCGDALFLFLHGDMGGPRDWAEIMAREVPSAWGACPHRYVCYGHFHFAHTSVGKSGVEHILCPSLSGQSIWEASKGFPADPKTLLLIVGARGGVTATEIIRPDDESEAA